MMQSTDIKSMQVLINQPTILKLVEVSFLLVVVAYLDLITGFEISCFVLYALPLVLGVLFFNIKVGVLLSILTTIVWVWADIQSGHTYSSDWIILINALNRLGFFLVTAFATELILNHRRKNSQHEQTNTIKMCRVCHKLNLNNKEWLALTSFLQEKNQAQVYSSYCADCARSSYVESGIFTSLADHAKQD